MNSFFLSSYIEMGSHWDPNETREVVLSDNFADDNSSLELVIKFGEREIFYATI